MAIDKEKERRITSLLQFMVSAAGRHLMMTAKACVRDVVNAFFSPEEFTEQIVLRS